VAPPGTKMELEEHPWLVALEEKWPGSTIVMHGVRHVNAIRWGDWEAEAKRRALAGVPFKGPGVVAAGEVAVDLLVSWTNAPGLAIARAKPLREHLVMLSVKRGEVLDLSLVEGAGSVLEKGGPGRAGRRLMAHICAEVGKEPTGAMVLTGWKDVQDEQMEDAFRWGESLREGVTKRTAEALEEAVVIQMGAVYLQAATPPWKGMCAVCRQRCEDLIAEILDDLYVREIRERRERFRESMRRIRRHWWLDRIDRGPRAAPWVIEDALKEAVEKMEEDERRESARKKRRLTLEMHQELEEAAGLRLVETELETSRGGMRL
jgi:hypothetical protein